MLPELMSLLLDTPGQYQEMKDSEVRMRKSICLNTHHSEWHNEMKVWIIVEGPDPKLVSGTWDEKEERCIRTKQEAVKTNKAE